MMARILITNNALDARAGTEMYVRDLAKGLLARGHSPVAYSTALGEVARELRTATVPVISSLDSLSSPPDLIHGHHHIETMTALLRFPGVPAVYFCHGWLPWQEAPPAFPRILRYVAVDEACRDRLVCEHSIPEDRVRVIHNFVDLERFKQRGPLPANPSRALVFSNAMREGSAELNAVRSACGRAGLTLDVVGLSAGASCEHPESILGNYDIVFAKARSALEALAAGSAVVLCDAIGVGPMVTARDLDRLRALNFGVRTLVEPIGSDALLREIGKYDPVDAAAASNLIRQEAGLEAALDQIVNMYHEVIAEHISAARQDAAAEGKAASDYVRGLGLFAKEREELAAELSSLRAAYGELNARSVLQERGMNLVSGELRDVQAVCSELCLRENELRRIKATLGWRALSWYGPIKYHIVLPARERIRSLIQRMKPEQ